MGKINEYAMYLSNKNNEIESTPKIKNIMFHPENFSIDLSNEKYVLKTTSVVGNVRDNNEDNATVMVSPYNEEIKLLAVCDGVGGHDNGEVASKITIQTLEEWFYSNDFSIMNSNSIKKSIAYAIGLANKKIIEEQNRKNIKYIAEGSYERSDMATTLTMALTTSEKTYIANLGDSRTYIMGKNKLVQITEDDSVVWNKYKDGICSKDDLRFQPGNNIISRCLGQVTNLCSITISTIPNSYKSLLLFSDGVTDILSDKDITDIINNIEDEYVVDGIIYGALNIDDDLKDFDIIAGKDNTTVAAYIKK